MNLVAGGLSLAQTVGVDPTRVDWGCSPPPGYTTFLVIRDSTVHIPVTVPVPLPVSNQANDIVGFVFITMRGTINIRFQVGISVPATTGL